MTGFDRQRGGRVAVSRRLAAVALLVVAALVLSACADTQIPQNSLDPASPQARSIDRLWDLVFWIAVVVFVLVESALVYAMWRFRHRRHDPDRPVKQVHGNTRLEVVWTIIPAIILAVVAVPTLQVLFDLRTDPPPEENALEINVIGHQWWWEFEYPDYGFTTAQEMYVPVGRTIKLNLTASDVIHSFWTPRLMGKRDAVPGRINTLVFLAEEEGDYLGQCAEFCGLAHADMRHKVVAVPPEEFEAWAEKHATPPPIPVEGPAARGFETFQVVCVACHVIDGAAGTPIDRTVPLEERTEWAFGPNLSYFGEREKFGGWSFDTDEAHLAAWLANPSDLKPMDPDYNDLEQGRILGMPNFGLTQEEIDDLVALLLSLR